MAWRSCFSALACPVSSVPFIVAQIGEEAVAHLSGAFDGLAMRMKPIASFLRGGIGHPNLLGGAGQVSLGDAHGADLVIVGVGLLELAHLAALQDLGFAPQALQSTHHFEAVTGGFQDKEVLIGGLPSGPALELAHRHFVEYLFGDRLRRSWASEHSGGEAVGVRIKADHTLDKV